MKFIYLTIVLFSTQIFASENYLMYCIGQEELKIHKAKKTGALSKLNQEIISELLQLSDRIKLKDKYLEKVCDSKNNEKSLSLLNYILLDKKSFYTIATEHEIKEQAIDLKHIKELNRTAVSLFINYLNNLQAETNKANCLAKKIPSLRKLLRNGRYILEDLDYENILEHKHDFELIFRKLKSPDLLTNC